MRARRRSRLGGSGELPVAPLIDMVFLLLAYFMVTASIQKQEADLAFSLPAVVTQSQPVSFPDELVVAIDSEGRPWVNGYAYGEVGETTLPTLTAMLSRFRSASEAAQSKPAVTIAPDDATPHECVVLVMDACAAAGVKGVSFALARD